MYTVSISLIKDDKLAQKNHKRMLEQCNKSCFQCRSTCEDRETDKYANTIYVYY